MPLCLQVPGNSEVVLFGPQKKQLFAIQFVLLQVCRICAADAMHMNCGEGEGGKHKVILGHLLARCGGVNWENLVTK